MKRPRLIAYNNSAVVIAYPKIVFIVNDARDDSLEAYLLQPLLSDECARLITQLRKQEEVRETVDAFLSIVCDDYEIRPEESHYAKLNKTCLIDTKKHRIATVEQVAMEDLYECGAVQIEYLCIDLLTMSDDSSSNDDSESTEHRKLYGRIV